MFFAYNDSGQVFYMLNGTRITAYEAQELARWLSSDTKHGDAVGAIGAKVSMYKQPELTADIAAMFLEKWGYPKDNKVGTVYKVIRYGHSALAVGEWSVEYQKDVTSYPRRKGSGLYAFLTLEDAMSFADHIAPGWPDEIEVWRCETDLSLSIPIEIVSYHGLYELFWQLVGELGHDVMCHAKKSESVCVLLSKGRICHVGNAPSGTVLCPSLTPRERVA